MRTNSVFTLLSAFVLGLAAGAGPATGSTDAGRLLVVVSNAREIPGTDHRATGVWAEELTVPMALFEQAGLQVDVASPTGRGFVFDPGSLTPAMVPDQDVRLQTIRFRLRHGGLMLKTLPLADVDPEAYAAVFVPGGHGVMFDVARDRNLARLVAQFLAEGKVVASVCHGPCFLPYVLGAGGRPAIGGRRVTGFSNEEEAAAGMAAHMPFSLQDELQRASGAYSSGPAFQEHVVVDRTLVTGQNPASSAAVARAALRLLGR